MKKLLLLSLFIVILGFHDGNLDTVKFHYSRSIYKIDNPTTNFQVWWDHWSNEQSWKNQYVDWPTDKRRRLIAYGPTIWLVDYWHLLKTMLVFGIMFLVWYGMRLRYYWFDVQYWSNINDWLFFNYKKWWFGLAFIIWGWFLYGLGHEVAFKVLLKSFWS